jgi:hypothetical protein
MILVMVVMVMSMVMMMSMVALVSDGTEHFRESQARNSHKRTKGEGRREERGERADKS